MSRRILKWTDNQLDKLNHIKKEVVSTVNRFC